MKKIVIFSIILTVSALAQRHMRKHTTNQSSGLNLVDASTISPIRSKVTVNEDSKYIYIKANGIPEHKVGSFPNSGNPHSIETQNYNFKITKFPKKNSNVTKLEMSLDFGVALNGVPFDPGAAEWYQGQRNSTWQYEALSGAVSLGVDENHAHVQPTGAYHYHGIPTQFIEAKNISIKNSPQIGWAADGFPIYALYFNGKEMKSGYTLKKGQRPTSSGEPGGTYDGTFVNDYEFTNTGSLDECNGKEIVSKEFPSGTYAYFLTNEFPVIPRCFRGTPDQSFNKKKNRNSSSRNMRNHTHNGHSRRRPPRSAINACKGKSRGDLCSFKAKHGNLSGKCSKIPDIMHLACRP